MLLVAWRLFLGGHYTPNSNNSQGQRRRSNNINKIMVARNVSIRLAQATQSKQQTGASDDKRIDLTGVWQGDYGKNGVEIVEIEYVQDHFVATKVTGDENVPFGKVSFYVPNASSLTSDRRTVVGYIQIAHRHYEAPRYVPGKLTVIDYDNFSFEWNTTVRKFMRVRTITEEQHHTHTQ
jgi:hypothetical protein